MRWRGLLAALLACGCAAVPAEIPDEPAVEAERLVMPPALPGRAMATPRLAVPDAGPVAAAVEPPTAVTPAPPAGSPPAPPTVVAPTAPLVPAATAPPSAPAASPRPSAPPAGGRDGPRVQLVAAGSEAEARAHWASFVQRLPDLAEGRVPQILGFERPGQATIWRLRVGGFTDAGEAGAWCDRLRARGGTCWVAG